MCKNAHFSIITLRERPELASVAAEWFHSKWTAPVEAYLECMEAYLSGETEYGWYLCLSGDTIVAGLGVIENEFLCMVQGDGEPEMSRMYIHR